MEQNEIIEGNSIIAEFMGEYTTDAAEWIKGDKHLVGEYKYHTDWNWLMSVVEKIEGLEQVFEFIINSRIAIVSLQKVDTEIMFNVSTKIEAVWLAVIEFIKWYNNINIVK